MTPRVRSRFAEIGVPLRSVLLALCIIVLVVVFLGRGDRPLLRTNQVDFRAFYCAGSALIGGHDPYRAEPLRSCEVATARASGGDQFDLLAVPAPLPSYSLAIFALIARLPFALASVLYFFVLIAALFVTSLALRQLTGYPLVGILAALGLSDGWVSLAYGQIVPISILCLCAAAALIARGRPVAAACCATAAMIEPHIALPACVALFCFNRRTRMPLLAGAAFLGALALATGGWTLNVEYFAHVLSAHALADSDDIGQFGLTTLLHRLGVDATVSLRLADLSYLAMAGIGLLVTRTLVRQTQRSEFLVVIPPACVLLGGPYLHTSQMAVAIPALLILIRRFQAHRKLLCAALLLMAIPWLELAENSLAPMLIAVTATTAVLAISVLQIRPKQTLAAVAAMDVLTIFERAIRTRFPPLAIDLHAEYVRAASGTLLADATWAIYARSTLSTAWYAASHAPVWIGLILMIVAAVLLARQRRSLVTNGPAS